VKSNDRVYIVNTNRGKNDDPIYENEMLKHQKCAAYGERKNEIEKIPPGAIVFLYASKCRGGKGFIAGGIATGEIKKADRNGKKDDEYFQYMNDFVKLEEESIELNDAREIAGVKNIQVSKTLNTLDYECGVKIWEYMKDKKEIAHTERNEWWKVLDKNKCENELRLVIGTDDPDILDWEETLDKVAALAKRMGYPVLNGIGDILTFGQNELARRDFYYIKAPKSR
jgi:hypothetical protein